MILNEGKVFIRLIDKYQPSSFYISTPQRDRSIFREGIDPNENDARIYRDILFLSSTSPTSERQRKTSSATTKKANHRNRRRRSSSKRGVSHTDDWGFFPLLAAPLDANVDILHTNRTNMIRLCEALKVNRWIQTQESSSLASQSSRKRQGLEMMTPPQQTSLSTSSAITSRPKRLPPPSVLLYAMLQTD